MSFFSRLSSVVGWLREGLSSRLYAWLRPDFVVSDPVFSDFG